MAHHRPEWAPSQRADVTARSFEQGRGWLLEAALRRIEFLGVVVLPPTPPSPEKLDLKPGVSFYVLVCVCIGKKEQIKFCAEITNL